MIESDNDQQNRFEKKEKTGTCLLFRSCVLFSFIWFLCCWAWQNDNCTIDGDFDHSTFRPHSIIILCYYILKRHTDTHSIHLFLKYNIMTISSNPLWSIFRFVYLFIYIFFGRFFFILSFFFMIDFRCLFHPSFRFVSFHFIRCANILCVYRWVENVVGVAFKKIDVMKEWLCIVRCICWPVNKRE